MIMSNDPTLKEGQKVVHAGKTYLLLKVVSLTEVVLSDPTSRTTISARPSEVSLATVEEVPTDVDLNEIPEEDLKVATRRFEIIEPLLEEGPKTFQFVKALAANAGVGASSIYRWLASYKSTNRLTSLLPQERSDSGTTKLSAEVESIVAATIREVYLTSQKKPASHVVREVRRKCFDLKLKPPHANTIWARIRTISLEDKMVGRLGKEAAERKLSPLRGKFPRADMPLEVVQMDHTQLDVILVDDVFRRHIARPYITMAVDVYSRMIIGFCLTFDPPSATSVGLCLVHSILPKDEWLQSHNVEGEWPCWGKPKKIYVDNAGEFRGKMLELACKVRKIKLEFRPKRNPRYGGHIERMIKTALMEVHGLKGSTFSNPRDRGAYDSEKEATMTLSELERWLTRWIVQAYHNDEHSETGVPPLVKYELGLLGDDQHIGSGVPAKITDPQKLRFDFMPLVERTIQNYGVSVNQIRYYHDILKKWIGAKDPKFPKMKRKFTFRVDPRDLSTIWFFDPDLERHFPIGYWDNRNPPITLWDFRRSRKKVEAQGGDSSDERKIFEAYRGMQEIEIEAQGKTAAVRLAQQRRKNLSAKAPSERPKTEKPKITKAKDDFGDDDDDVKPFKHLGRL